jgi:trehalose 6-phosphate phosphatase
MWDIEAGAEGGRAGEVLARPHQWALFIDIDGTLLSVAPTPDAVSVRPGLIALLERLTRGLGGAVALLTGRRIADADRLFAPLKLVAAGVHGSELRSQQSGPIDELAPPIPQTVVDAMHNIGHIAPGILVEHKGAGAAVHYRNAPLARRTLESQLASVLAASSYDLVLRQGRMVIEVLPRGFSKGTALVQLAAKPPFAGRRPIMIGDDAGDEAALSAADRLGGLALRVAGEHFGKDVADFDSVDDVHAWLEAFANRLRLEENVENVVKA